MNKLRKIFISFMCIGLIALKKKIKVDTGFRLNSKGNISWGEKNSFGKNCGIYVGTNASLVIGPNTSFQDRCHINCLKNIIIGANCIISWDVEILDTDFHQIKYDSHSVLKEKDVYISNNVWIGARAIILKGVTIGENSVIAAGSVVTKSFPSNSLIAGNPAKLVKNIRGWEL